MKTIIAGSRTITDYFVVAKAIKHYGWADKITSVVSGCEPRGVDNLGRQWAGLRHIPVIRFPAEWAKYGSAAGPIRNDTMARMADALIAVWDGQSDGTRDMIQKANKHGLLVYVYDLSKVPKQMEMIF